MKCNKSILSSEMQKRLRKLIDSKSSHQQIAQAIGLRDDAIITEIVILLRSGYNITKSHLMHLVGVDDDIFEHIKTLAAPTDFHCVDTIDKIKEKFCTNTKITEHMLVLVLNYLRLRQYLKLANMPYFDADEDKLMNAEVFLRTNGNKISFDPSVNASTSSDVTNNIPMDGDEFDDEMIDKIFVDWSPAESNENVPKNIERTETVEPPVLIEHNVIASTSNANINETNAELLHDISVEEIIDDEMIDDLFDDWSQENTNAVKTKPIEIEKSATSIKENFIQSTHANSAAAPSAVPIEVKKRKVERVFVRPKTQVKYCSDSDSEEENQPIIAKQQRALPNWMAQRPPSTLTASTASKTEEPTARRMKQLKF